MSIISMDCERALLTMGLL